MSNRVLPTYFLSHGGGPWPFMREQFGERYDALEASLKAIPAQIGGPPEAILVISSHWQGESFMVSSGERPPMIYDYSGFPPHTYAIQYPAPGSPQLAARVKALLDGAGQPARLDAQRGFDHGTFSALYPVFPKADVPIVQLSIRHDYDPLTHIAAGRALAPLRSEGVLIVGSGLSYHNLRQFGPTGAAASHQFDAWLRESMALAPSARRERMLAWERAPGARAAHPREDHLVPLWVALGAAEQDPASVPYHEDNFFGALAVSSFRFGAALESINP